MPKKKIIITSILLLVIISFSFLSFNKPIKTTKTVNSNKENLKISIDGVSADTIPSSGNYYLTKYKCYNNNTKITWDQKNYKLNITNKNKKAGVSCNLTFKSNPSLRDATRKLC